MSKKFTGINKGPDKDSLLHSGASTTASTDIATTHDDKSPVYKAATSLVAMMNKKK